MIRRTLDECRDRLLRMSHRRLSASFRIDSHLTVRERVALYRLARTKSIVVEIGSYTGASACCFAAALRQTNGLLLCIDTWNNDAMTESKRDTYAEFTRNTAEFSDRIRPLRGYSAEMAEQVARQIQYADLLFIDGNHAYESVKEDWDAYQRFLAPGSIVAFHDWGWAEGVKRVVEQQVKPLVTQFETLPNLWWGTMGSQAR